MQLKFFHYFSVFFFSAIAGSWLAIEWWHLTAADLFFIKAHYLHFLHQNWVHINFEGNLYGVDKIAASRQFVETADRFHSFVIAQLLIGSLFAYIFYVLFGGRNPKKEELSVRGTQIFSANKVRNRLKRESSRLRLAGIPYPKKLETQGMLFVGSTGSGKSSGINELLSQIRPLGEKMIVVDPGGEYLRRFARKGDIMLNPYDERSVAWNPFCEIKNEFDIDTIVSQLIPNSDGHSREWTTYARTFFESAIEKIISMKVTTPLSFLIFRFTKADRDQMRDFFIGTPASKYFDKGSEGILGSVISILTKHIKNLAKLDSNGSFSLRDWIRSDSKGWLFITYQAENRVALEDLIGTWVAIAGNEILSLEPDLNRRIWLAFDEFPRVGKVQNFAEILTNGRKNGLAAILGMQTTSQLQKLYGREEAETILSCLNSAVILKNADPSTAETMSKMIGQTEVERKTINENSNRQKSTSTTRTITPAVLPSEILNLPANSGYLKLAGHVCKISLPFSPNVQGHPAFVPNKRFSLANEEKEEEIVPEPEKVESPNPPDLEDLKLTIFGG